MSKSKELIIKHLRNNKGAYLSGAYLSSTLNISRSAVWKNVNELRNYGYLIDAKAGYGYRLESEPDRLESELLLNNNMHYLKTVDSTNLEARRIAEKDEGLECIIVAEEQLKGRGRIGSSWYSPPHSGLWFSMLLRPEFISPAKTTSITLVIAAVLAEFFNGKYTIPAKVKWPNDLLVGNKKIGGILTEIKGESDRIEYLIIGIGLNVNQQLSDFPVELEPLASSLYLQSGRFINRTELLLDLTDELKTACALFFREGFAPFYQLWKKNNATLGRHVTVKYGAKTLNGKAIDIKKDGALLLQDNLGINHIINYGDII